MDEFHFDPGLLSLGGGELVQHRAVDTGREHSSPVPALSPFQPSRPMDSELTPPANMR